MDNKFDFILSKNQRDSYIANWKKLHADKVKLTVEDYILHAFLSPAIPDIRKKYTAGFIKSKNSAKSGAMHQNIARLKYCLKCLRPLANSINFELDESQRNHLYEMICNTYNISY